MMWNIKLIKYRENKLIVTKYVFPYRCDIFIQLNRFYRTSSYASAVLAVVILWVRLSVCHTHALWQNQTMHCGYFDTTWKGNYSSFLSPTVVGGWRPLPSEVCTQKSPTAFEKCRLRQISAYNVSTVPNFEEIFKSAAWILLLPFY